MPEQNEGSLAGAIPLTGVLLLLLVCGLWGGNMVSIKISNLGISPLRAAVFRSALAAILLWIYAWKKGEAILLPGRDLVHGIVIGMLFGLDFLFLYWGTVYTHASRAVIFLYTHPFWVAMGAHLFIAGDRLNVSKGGGLVLAFAGLLLVFGSRPPALGPLFWLGDVMEVAAAVSWAATTLYIKRILASPRVTHFQTLFSQLLFSIPVLGTGALLFERGRSLRLTPPVLLAFAYQSVVVAFFSYLLWFWLIQRFSVSRLAAFTFLVPCFGVILSGVVLGEALPLLLWGGLLSVAAGIYLVNRPERVPQPGRTPDP